VQTATHIFGLALEMSRAFAPRIHYRQEGTMRSRSGLTFSRRETTQARRAYRTFSTCRRYSELDLHAAMGRIVTQHQHDNSPDCAALQASREICKYGNENAVCEKLRHWPATPTATRRPFAHRHFKPHDKPDAGAWRAIVSTKRIHGGKYAAIA
jgi:hypothetical protein